MPDEVARKFGFELEYASGSAAIMQSIHAAGLTGDTRLHDYHCRCESCAFTPTERLNPRTDRYEVMPPYDLRGQRDSTADGEFITRPIMLWSDFTRIASGLTAAAASADATTSNRCGLHVHVDTTCDSQLPMREQRSGLVPSAYLAFERYFTEIVAPGTSIRKRDMNTTLMEAARNYVADCYGGVQPDRWLDMGRSEVDTLLQQAIQRDRHVDLNWSRNNGTWEFRSFNATNATWRIELACRLSVAFVEATPALRDAVEQQVRGSRYWPEGCDSPWGEIIRPAFNPARVPHLTKKPVIEFERFVDLLCEVDDELRPLIERQANYMRTRYARQIEVAA